VPIRATATGSELVHAAEPVACGLGSRATLTNPRGLGPGRGEEYTGTVLANAGCSGNRTIGAE